MDAERQSVAIAVVECKAPNVCLDMKAKEQLLDYCDLVGANYAMLTNGIDQYCFRYASVKDEYLVLRELPNYKNMLSDQYEEWDVGELPPRIPFSQLESYLKEDFQKEKQMIMGMVSVN